MTCPGQCAVFAERQAAGPEGIKGARENIGVFMQPDKIIKTDPDEKYRSVLSASTLAGNDVRNSSGEDLGKISEIMIDIPTGRVAYAVLSFGGFLGMGDRLFALPWSILKLDEDEKCFILDVDKQVLKNAPGFDKSNWPDMSDTTWGGTVFSYYHAEPYWETREKTFRGGGGY
ncbi:MAG TPA: PRC-barrel domain-containing protein [Bryobacteraceae bacterium]|nr:PRC-barrel domain-containing protein [Bryobacteraceae bacterium]